MHICKKCRPITQTQEWKDTQTLKDISDYLQQINISKKNQTRLAELSTSTNPKIAEQTQVVVEVSRIQSHKKKRLRTVRKNHPDVYARLIHAGLLFPDDWYEIASSAELFYEEEAVRNTGLQHGSKDDYAGNRIDENDFEFDIPF